MGQSTPSALTCLRVGLGIVAGIAFVMVAVCTLVMLPTVFQLFNPAAYKAALRTLNTYERVPSILAEIAANSEDTDEEDGILRYLDEEDYELIFAHILPADWAKAQIESLIDQEFAYLNSDEPSLKLNLSLVELKTSLQGSGGDEMMTQIVKSWPACSSANEVSWENSVKPGVKFSPPECRPSDAVLEQAQPQLRAVVNEIVAEMPDTVDLAEPSDDTSQASTTPADDPRPTIRLIKLAAFLSPALSLILLGVVTALVVRSWGSLFRWTGIMILIAGLLAFLFAVGFGVMVEAFVSAVMQDLVADGETGIELVTIIIEAFRHVLRSAALWSGGLSCLTGLAGIVAAVLGFVMFRSRTLPAELAPPAYG